MANIDIKNISDLDLNGKNLFDDSEGFMTELCEDYELETVNGGLVPTTPIKDFEKCITHLTRNCSETVFA